MVPLCDILEDVKQLFNAREARLPESNSEVDSILRRGNNSPGAMRDDIAAAGLLENEAGATLGHSDTAFCSRCGSDKHTREICGVDDPANNRGEELKAVMVPVEVASHDPNEKWRGSGKVKGTVVWYCSNCGDGPLGPWQNVCTNCSHDRCVSCATEYTR